MISSRMEDYIADKLEDRERQREAKEAAKRREKESKRLQLEKKQKELLERQKKTKDAAAEREKLALEGAVHVQIRDYFRSWQQFRHSVSAAALAVPPAATRLWTPA